MRLARVIGRVTLSQKVSEIKAGALLICEAMDSDGLKEAQRFAKRNKPMAESLVVYDHMGAGEGDLIAFSEGGEATQPFRPAKVPIDAYCAAIVDTVDMGGTEG